MNGTVLTSALAATALCSACAPPLNSRIAATPQSLAAESDDPVLALLEYRIAELIERKPDLPDAICAGWRSEGGMMDVAALPADKEARLQRRFARVVPFAQCTIEDNTVRTRAGQPAILFDVHELECAHPGDCTAWAGYTQTPRINGWNYFRARFRNGYWQIRPEDLGIELTAAE